MNHSYQDDGYRLPRKRKRRYSIYIMNGYDYGYDLDGGLLEQEVQNPIQIDYLDGGVGSSYLVIEVILALLTVVGGVEAALALTQRLKDKTVKQLAEGSDPRIVLNPDIVLLHCCVFLTKETNNNFSTVLDLVQVTVDGEWSEPCTHTSAPLYEEVIPSGTYVFAIPNFATSETHHIVTNDTCEILNHYIQPGLMRYVVDSLMMCTELEPGKIKAKGVYESIFDIERVELEL